MGNEYMPEKSRKRHEKLKGFPQAKFFDYCGRDSHASAASTRPELPTQAMNAMNAAPRMALPLAFWTQPP